MTLWIDVGVVTCEDCAKIYTEQMGRQVSLGDPEFRVMDDLENPGWSSDYPSMELALKDYPGATVLMH